jgi:flagellar biogenesis protein FliO
MKRRLLSATTGLVLGLTLALQAAPAESPSAFSTPALPETGVSILRVGGALALVVGLFLGGVWVFKNWQRLLWRTRGAPKLNVIEVRPLGGRHAVYLVGYEQQRLLLAASPTGVQFFTHLPDGEASLPSAAPPFTRILDEAVGAKVEKPAPELTMERA